MRTCAPLLPSGAGSDFAQKVTRFLRGSVGFSSQFTNRVTKTRDMSNHSSHKIIPTQRLFFFAVPSRVTCHVGFFHTYSYSTVLVSCRRKRLLAPSRLTGSPGKKKWPRAEGKKREGVTSRPAGPLRDTRRLRSTFFFFISLVGVASSWRTTRGGHSQVIRDGGFGWIRGGAEGGGGQASPPRDERR